MLTIARTPVALRALAEEWSDLHAACRSQNPFNHPAWCLSWAHAFDHDELRIVVERDPSGCLIGVLPLMARAAAGRVWATLGMPLVDFGAPLVDSSTNVVPTLLDWLAEYSAEWDEVELIGLPLDLASGLVDVAAQRRLCAQITATEVCPRIDISSIEDWRKALPPKRLRRLQGNLDRLEMRHGAECREVCASADITAAIRRFESLRLQSWWQRSGFKTLPPAARGNQHCQLLGTFATALAPTTFVSVVEMVSGDRLLSSSVLFWSNDTVLVALKATDTRLGTSVSPGLGLDMFVIELAASRGVSSVGYGRGDEDYKFTLGAVAETTADVSFAHPDRPLRLLNRLARQIGRSLS
ncbi:GNAT family N-acetyltransferase [Nocardia asiatica]|uniref:GNAT family N-acetyltransferase n=1 Tax=Nocardia asiatica TaxID=209252 RepID=UPI000A002059|nr:GNAT family N-acetyltransferase [Nocardia asiatica]